MTDEQIARISPVDEWRIRKRVVDAAIDVLADGQPRTAQQITAELQKRGLNISKRLLNSVLFSEARRYVVYDKQAYSYTLRRTALSESVEVPIHNPAPELKARYVGRNDEYTFVSGASTGPAFFETATKSRTTEIVFNKEHPLFSSFAVIFESTPTDNHAVSRKLAQAKKCIALMIVAWAKFENEQPAGPRKFKAEEMRIEWGRNVRRFLIGDSWEK